MGTCLANNIQTQQYHPCLGYYKTLQSQVLNLPLIQTSILIETQESYLEWNKNLNKLRYNNQLKDSLYLPVDFKYSQKNTPCGASKTIDLWFQKYGESLIDFFGRFKANRKGLGESVIWYIVYLLTVYGKYYERKGLKIDPFTIMNLVVCGEKIKIIDGSIVRQISTSSDLMEIMVQEESRSHIDTDEQSHKSLIYSIGLIMLECATFQPFSSDKKSKGQNIIKDSIKNCQTLYSPLFCKTLRQILQDNNQKKLSLCELYEILEFFQSEITNKNEFGGLVSMLKNDSFRTSDAYQHNRTTINNTIDLLKVSDVNRTSGMSKKKSKRLQKQNEDVEINDFVQQNKKLSIL